MNDSTPTIGRLQLDLARRVSTEVPMFLGESLLAMFHTVPAEVPSMGEPGMRAKIREAFDPNTVVSNEGIATIRISGSLARRPSLEELVYFGAEDTEKVSELVREAAATPEIRGILLDIDSPGGFSVGITELANEVRAANKIKPVVSHSGGIMASAAYFFGSQAGAVVASPSAVVGAIGSYITLMDTSKMMEAIGVKVQVFKNKEADLKPIGVPGVAVTPEQAEHLTSSAQEAFNQFRSTVLKARPSIPAEAMRGQSVTGAQAKKLGLVDSVGDTRFAVSVLRSEIRRRDRQARQ